MGKWENKFGKARVWRAAMQRLDMLYMLYIHVQYDLRGICGEDELGEGGHSLRSVYASYSRGRLSPNPGGNNAQNERDEREATRDHGDSTLHGGSGGGEAGKQGK